MKAPTNPNPSPPRLTPVSTTVAVSPSSSRSEKW